MRMLFINKLWKDSKVLKKFIIV